jgi:hypothetical protein
MLESPARALHQGFLPPGEEHAFVWKYSDLIGGRRPRHFHGEPEINLVVRGSATFGVGERSLRVTQGELVVFPAAQDHVLLERSSDLYLYAIGLASGLSEEVLSGEPPLPVHVRLDELELATVLTQAADACSGGRPGARRESLESYVQRLEQIEAIAGSKRGVEKVFAMQAGRELRVMVKPDVVDDLEAHLLAREVAKQIEEELTYPGQVRVTVIRESRATEIAR